MPDNRIKQLDLLKKLKDGKVTLDEFLNQTNDQSTKNYKVTKENFLSDKTITEKTKKHELHHAKVYEDEGIEVEFFIYGDDDRIASTSASEDSLINWLEGKTTEDYLDLLRRVTEAPQEPGSTDQKILEILSN